MTLQLNPPNQCTPDCLFTHSLVQPLCGLPFDPQHGSSLDLIWIRFHQMLQYIYIGCVSLCQLTVEGWKGPSQDLPFHTLVTGSSSHVEASSIMVSEVQQAGYDTGHITGIRLYGLT